MEDASEIISHFEDGDLSVRRRAGLECEQKPPHRAVHLMHGDLATDAVANTARAYKEARLVPIEVFCRKVDR